MNTITIPRPWSTFGNEAGASNIFHWAGNTFSLNYRFSQGPINSGSEPWLALALLPAMICGIDLRLEEPVSARLLENSGKIQHIYSQWDSRFKKIRVEAAATTRDKTYKELPPRQTGCFFSGGVDSFYTLFKLYDEIDCLIYLENPFLDEAGKDRTNARVRKAAAEVNKPLLEVRFNLRDFTDRYLEWELSHGAVFASVALLLSPQFSKIFISSSHDYFDLNIPWGTHPLLTPLWSTDELELVEHGYEAFRIQKVAFISEYQAALDNLQVCWQAAGNKANLNCGVCKKCLHTMSSLRAVGSLERCRAFASPLDLDKLTYCIKMDTYAQRYLLEALQLLQQNGNDQALQKALRQCLANSAPLSPALAISDSSTELAELKQELRYYRTAIRFQLAEQIHAHLSRNKALYWLGQSAAHLLARFI